MDGGQTRPWTAVFFSTRGSGRVECGRGPQQVSGAPERLADALVTSSRYCGRVRAATLIPVCSHGRTQETRRRSTRRVGRVEFVPRTARRRSGRTCLSGRPTPDDVTSRIAGVRPFVVVGEASWSRRTGRTSSQCRDCGSASAGDAQQAAREVLICVPAGRRRGRRRLRASAAGGQVERTRRRRVRLSASPASSNPLDHLLRRERRRSRLRRRGFAGARLRIRTPLDRPIRPQAAGS